MSDRIGFSELSPFLLENVEFLDEELGRGAYGKVEKVKIPGATAAAKILHRQLITLGSSQQVDKWVGDFLGECNLMSRLRHPHIVQFLGICYPPDSELPVLLMEKLQTSLDSLLEETHNIPIEIKVPILIGTASGLVYLHSQSPPIAHRDLTARNILIDSNFNAKITDLGVSRMVTIQPGRQAAIMTRGPGNVLYMPPEAQAEENAKYNVSIDIFSFGVTSLFTLTQVFPLNLKPPSYMDSSGRLQARNEIERREEYVSVMKDALGEDHLLVKLTLDCLKFVAANRPSAEAVLRRLEEFKETLPKEQSKLELMREIRQKDSTIQQLQVKVGNTTATEPLTKGHRRTSSTFISSDKPIFAGEETTIHFNASTSNTPLQLKNFVLHREVKNSLLAVDNRDSKKYALTIRPPQRGKYSVRLVIDDYVDKTLPLTVAPDRTTLGKDATIVGVSGLNKPMGVAVNSQKHFIVTMKSEVGIFDREWKKIRTFGSQGDADGQFNSPDGVAVDCKDHIFIVDTFNYRIQKFSSKGEFLASVGAEGTGRLQFGCPSGIAYNKTNGRLYIADQENNRIQVLTTDLTFHSFIGEPGSGVGELSSPDGVFCDDNGNLFVADSEKNRIKVFTSEGKFIRDFGKDHAASQLQCPAGIAVSAGIVYVTEHFGKCISMFTVAGDFIGSFGSKGIRAGQFKDPVDVLIDEEQNVIVVDSANDCIQYF